MRIRAATAADVAALGTLEQTLFGAEAWSEDTVRSDLDTPGRRVVVAVDREGDEGGVVGYAVTMLAGDLVDLQRIGVSPALQGRGIARALLETVLEAAAADGAEAMLLEVSTHNLAASRLYERAGFTAIDRRRGYYRDGSDAVVMRRPLTMISADGRG